MADCRWKVTVQVQGQGVVVFLVFHMEVYIQATGDEARSFSNHETILAQQTRLPFATIFAPSSSF